MNAPDIDVWQGPNGPIRVRWAGRVHTVDRIVDRWVLQGRWWAGEERRLYYRFLLHTGLTIDVYRSGATWRFAGLVSR